jgi:glycosyltransferase involved in cell wall biosynthesis
MAGGVVDHAIDLVRFAPGPPATLVLPPWPGLDRAARRAAAAGVPVLRLAPAPRPGGAGAWLAGRPVDLLHVHYADASDATPAVEAALAAGIAVVSTDHACADDAPAASWEARRQLASRQASVLADSVAVASRLQARLGRPVEVAYHGIDVGHFSAGPDRASARQALALPVHEPVLAGIGALFSHKGMHRLIRAIAEVIPKPCLVLAGEGPERPRLEAEARALRVKLRLLGWVDDVRPLLAAADAFAMASDSEGLPSAVLQAMAAGVPVVATDAGGTKEAMGEFGVLVPLGDEVALAAGIRRALGGACAGERLAARARVAAHFEVRDLAARVAGLHAAIAGPGGRLDPPRPEQLPSVALSRRRTGRLGRAACRGSS